MRNESWPISKFEKGNQWSRNGNGAGRPSGSRNRFAQRVFDDIFRHWNEPAGDGMCKGQAALEFLYRERPGDYLKLAASLMPKEFVFENTTEMDAGERARIIEMLRPLAAPQQEQIEGPRLKLLNGH